MGKTVTELFLMSVVSTLMTMTVSMLLRYFSTNKHSQYLSKHKKKHNNELTKKLFRVSMTDVY